MQKLFSFLFLAFAGILLASCTTSDPSTPSSVQGDVLTPPSSMDGTFRAMSASSILEWQGSRVGSSHYGTIDIQNGQIVFSGGDLVEGEFIIDMTTINTTDLEGDSKKRLDDHLKNADFFDVENHPQAVLKVRSARPLSENLWAIEADLTIKGITHPITFEVESSYEGEDWILTGNFTIDRTLWEVRYGSGKFFEDLGDKMIRDEIAFDLKLVLRSGE